MLLIFFHSNFEVEKELWQPYLKHCFQNFYYLPVSTFELVAQPKLRLRSLEKSIKYGPMGSTKIVQKSEF